MDRITDLNAAGALPTLPSFPGGAVKGYFQEQNAGTGTAATLIRGYWLNQLQEELMAIISAAALTPNASSTSQVLQALQVLFNARSFASLTNPGYFYMPNQSGQNLLIQWCRNISGTTTTGGLATLYFTFPVAFIHTILGYSYVPANEGAYAYSWTATALNPTVTQQPIAVSTSNGTAGSLVAVSGIVIGY